MSHRNRAFSTEKSMKKGKLGSGACLTHSTETSLGLDIIQSWNLKAHAFLTQTQRELFLTYRKAGFSGRQSSIITLAYDAHFSRYHKFIQCFPESSNQNSSLVIQVEGNVFLIENCIRHDLHFKCKGHSCSHDFQRST